MLSTGRKILNPIARKAEAVKKDQKPPLTTIPENRYDAI